MAKLKLNLDDLKVESFATTPELQGRRGTVFGQTDPTCYDNTCGTCNPSCAATCQIDCNPTDQTCGQTCGNYTACCTYPTCMCNTGLHCTEIGNNTCGGSCPDTCGTANGEATCDNTCPNTCAGDTCGCTGVSCPEAC